jgi:CBS domain containing-hemolysin-like protein
MSPAYTVSLIGVAAILVLVLANAYFVATEFSLVAVRRSQVKLWEREGRRGAAATARALVRLDDSIAATQLGITLASIGLGFLGEPALAGLLAPAMARIGFESAASVHTAALGVAFAFVTFLHVVVGELAPKALALDRPGPVALACATPLLIFSKLTRPVLWAMNGCGNALVRAFGIKPTGEGGHGHSSEEIQLLISEAGAAGVIRPSTGRMLGGVFGLLRTRVRDVMVPRERVYAIPRRIDPEALLDRLREEGYTRLPVYEENLDHVVGVLHTKDLFHLYAKRRVVVMEDAIRPFLEMRPELEVAGALTEFRRGRSHMAVVREPGGPLLGIVTLEDVLEEIVGEIEDEHDVPRPPGSGTAGPSPVPAPLA